MLTSQINQAVQWLPAKCSNVVGTQQFSFSLRRLSRQAAYVAVYYCQMNWRWVVCQARCVDGALRRRRDARRRAAVGLERAFDASRHELADVEEHCQRCSRI